ncbi:PREDICTED: enhancer of mRNA-decapping protein 3 isoform X2 [Nicrophorus vespilloides]|nr:PREDICTED: enhancer of mRNA-decapping protein 3 isoform X2 [Nicrophorus vespilloides]
MSQWIGSAVSIKCAECTYQGEIINATNASIILSKAFCDGKPCISDVTVLANEINDLKIIEKQPTEKVGNSTVPLAKPVAKRAGRTHSTSENSSTSKAFNGSAKSKPIDIQGGHDRNYNEGSNSYKNSYKSRDKSKGKWVKGWKDEECFGSPLDTSLLKEFDFEKNLALFNKQKVFDEINSQRPDIKNADQQKRPTKYRHDENIIATVPTAFRQIVVQGEEEGGYEYFTDDGLIVPSISLNTRNQLWDVADRMGFGWERRTELMGRATTEMAVHLLGGAHRLNPHNTHQFPVVVVICGPNRQGAMGINTARHLSSQGVKTIVYTVSHDSTYVKQELSLYKLTKNKYTSNIASLPIKTDLIIVALCDEDMIVYSELSEWITNNKAPILSIDPPVAGTPGISSKFSIVPVLPQSYSPENGKIYLCNLGFPLELFALVGIKYKSPFGPKFVIPLHLQT